MKHSIFSLVSPVTINPYTINTPSHLISPCYNPLTNFPFQLGNILDDIIRSMSLNQMKILLFTDQSTVTIDICAFYTDLTSTPNTVISPITTSITISVIPEIDHALSAGFS